MTQMAKNLPAMQETWLWSLGWEDPLEKGMATLLAMENASILAWRIPKDRCLVGYSPWGHQESDATEGLSTKTHNVTF